MKLVSWRQCGHAVRLGCVKSLHGDSRHRPHGKSNRRVQSGALIPQGGLCLYPEVSPGKQKGCGQGAGRLCCPGSLRTRVGGPSRLPPCPGAEREGATEPRFSEFHSRCYRRGLSPRRQPGHLCPTHRVTGSWGEHCEARDGQEEPGEVPAPRVRVPAAAFRREAREARLLLPLANRKEEYKSFLCPS